MPDGLARKCLTLKESFRYDQRNAYFAETRRQGSARPVLADGEILYLHVSAPLLRAGYPDADGSHRSRLTDRGHAYRIFYRCGPDASDFKNALYFWSHWFYRVTCCR